MVSPLLVGLRQQVAKLDGFFIARGKDAGDYTDAEQASATAFSLLVSAEIEGYVENRCLAVATEALTRFKASQPSAAGRSLLMWHVAKRPSKYSFPIHEHDMFAHIAMSDDAALAYTQMVRASHGLDDEDFAKLVFPLGVRTLPPALQPSLKTLAERRNPASHAHFNRARQLRQPEEERKLVDVILEGFEVVDDELEKLISTFPV